MQKCGPHVCRLTDKPNRCPNRPRCVIWILLPSLYSRLLNPSSGGRSGLDHAKLNEKATDTRFDIRNFVARSDAEVQIPFFIPVIWSSVFICRITIAVHDLVDIDDSFSCC